VSVRPSPPLIVTSPTAPRTAHVVASTGFNAAAPAMISGPRTIINRKFEGDDAEANAGRLPSRRHINCTHEVITSLRMTKRRRRRCAFSLCQRRTTPNNSKHFSLPLADQVAITCQYLSLYCTQVRRAMHGSNTTSYATGRETDQVYFASTSCLTDYTYIHRHQHQHHHHHHHHHHL